MKNKIYKVYVETKNNKIDYYSVISMTDFKFKANPDYYTKLLAAEDKFGNKYTIKDFCELTKNIGTEFTED